MISNVARKADQVSDATLACWTIDCPRRRACCAPSEVEVLNDQGTIESEVVAIDFALLDGDVLFANEDIYWIAWSQPDEAEDDHRDDDDDDHCLAETISDQTEHADGAGRLRTGGRGLPTAGGPLGRRPCTSFVLATAGSLW